MEKSTMNKKCKTDSTGGAKPRAHLLPMMALVLIGLLALAGVVSADTYWNSTPLVTKVSGTVTGDVWIDMKDTWSTSTAYQSDRYNTTTFTIPSDALNGNVSWARLYVVVYAGSQTLTYTGYETVNISYNGGTLKSLSTSEPLNLVYTQYTGAVSRAAPTTESPYMVNLTRVTSDYVSEYNLTDLLKSATLQDVTVDIHTWNTSSSPKFDGRIKEAKLVVAYNCPNFCKYVTKYYVNEGQDTASYQGNESISTTFNAPVASGDKVILYVNAIATADGKYNWSGTDITGSKVQVSVNQSKLDTWNLSDLMTVASGVNTLTFNRSPSGNTYYKTPLAILVVKSGTYDFSGNYAGTPVGYKQEVSSKPPTTVDVPEWDVTNSNLAYNDNVYETGSASDMTYFGAQRFDFTICQNRDSVESLTATWVGKGYNLAGNGTTLYIWNWNNGYEQLDSTASGDKVTLIGSKSSGLSDYINEDGMVTILAVQNYASTFSSTSHLDTDYVKLAVTDS